MFRSIVATTTRTARSAPSRALTSSCSCRVYFPKSSSKPKSSPPAASPASPTTTAKVSATKTHLTPKEISSKKSDESNVDAGPPEPLDRPLGVAEPPTKGKQSREEWRKDLLDQNKRINERRHLVQQVGKGYFHDYNNLRHHGGKSFVAPETLIREDLAKYFPDIVGLSLATKANTHTTDLWPGKVSLVSFTSFKSSEDHINSFVRPTLADLKDEPSFQYVQINLQENPLKSFLVNLFLSSLRSQIPLAYQPTYLLSSQSLEYLRAPMGMENKHVGYVFLVDSNAKIRWAGAGWATVEEEEALRKCALVLMKRSKAGLR